MDFKKDLKEILLTRLKELETVISTFNYTNQIDEHESVDSIYLKYLNLIRRRVEPKPRQVLQSRELVCPPGYEQSLKDIEKEIIKGEDITPYLSKGVQSLNRLDSLLYDWDIHHIHLGSVATPGQFASRTGPVLFARFQEDNAYFIQIMQHGRGYKPWFRQDLVKIIQKNWPNTLASHELNAEIEDQPSDDDIEVWRKGSINVPVVTSNGTPYITPGGGQTLSGHNILDVALKNYVITNTERFETFFKANLEVIKKKATDAGEVLGDPPKFKLKNIEVENDQLIFYIDEETSGVKFRSTSQ